MRNHFYAIGADAKFYELRCPQRIMRARALERRKNAAVASLWVESAGYEKLRAGFEPVQEDEDFVIIKGVP